MATQNQGTHIQALKLSSTLKQLTCLGLNNKKKDLMKKSIFHKLLLVENDRESSATLITGLCECYDEKNKKFCFNSETSFSFCSQEVAYVLGIKDTGTDYKDPNGKSRLPPFVHDLLRRFGGTESQKFSASNLKKILKAMPVDDKCSELEFKRLMSFYLVEQVLLPGANPKKPRCSFWELVEDLEAFNKVNWAKAIYDHTCESLETLKRQFMQSANQHNFKGAPTVLEALIYERIPSRRPQELVCFSDPPIQKWDSQRIDFWEKFGKLTPEEIEPCPCCGQGLAFEDGTSSAAPVMETSSSVLETGLALEDGTSSAAPVMETSCSILETDTYPEVAKPKGKAAAPKKATKKAASRKAPTEAAPKKAPKKAPTAAPKKAPTKCLEMGKMTVDEKNVFTILLSDLSQGSLGIVKDYYDQRFWSQLLAVYHGRMCHLNRPFKERTWVDMISMGQDVQYQYNIERAAGRQINSQLEGIFGRCQSCHSRIPIFPTSLQKGQVSTYNSASQAKNAGLWHGSSSGGGNVGSPGFSNGSHHERGSIFRGGESSRSALCSSLPEDIVYLMVNLVEEKYLRFDQCLKLRKASAKWSGEDNILLFALLRNPNIPLAEKAEYLLSEELF